MDSESAAWQLMNVYLNPKAIHRFIRTHRHTKGHWSRDDPSFLILETSVIFLSALIWYLSPFTLYSFRSFFRILFTFIISDLYISGLIFATLVWLCLNHWGKAPRTAHSTEQDVEWRFCFDVYCNAFTAIIIDVNLGMLLVRIFELISSNWFFRIFLPNLILAIGSLHFILLAVPCIMVLPFLKPIQMWIYLGSVVLLFFASVAFSIPFGQKWMIFHHVFPEIPKVSIA